MGRSSVDLNTLQILTKYDTPSKLQCSLDTRNREQPDSWRNEVFPCRVQPWEKFLFKGICTIFLNGNDRKEIFYDLTDTK